MSNEVQLEESGGCLIVRFTRPEVRNPLSVSVLTRLGEIVRDRASNSKFKAFIFSGTGNVFASGANLNEIAALTPDMAREFAESGQDLMNSVAALPQTTIAAINGFCFGGALDLALACDRRIASPNARFAHPGTGLGIITGWGGTQRLPRLIGQTAAFEMFFTAEAVSVDRALNFGLIDEIADDALATAILKTI